MSLIKSISGIRGTIGGQAGDNLTPIDIVECTAAFGEHILRSGLPKKVVIGRDGRISGPMVSNLVANTLMMQGIDVVDLGFSTTPTVEIVVPTENAGAGIILTASHNPKHWNALKFLNEKGEFISKEIGESLLALIAKKEMTFAEVDHIGSYTQKVGYMDIHIDRILSLDYIDADLIRKQKFSVVVDCINSTGAIAIPKLLEKLNVKYTLINEQVNGEFAHNPEPLPGHLKGLSKSVIANKAHMGIVVDPDVDRLAFVCEDGSMFGEEYTLVAASDFVLSKKPGNTVSNLSSTRALNDVTIQHGGQYNASAVGEVNVVNLMKATNAVIGGEGNGGIILPDLHYGRDALVGIALVLNLLAEKQLTMSALRNSYPTYHISKNKISLTPATDIDALLSKVKKAYAKEKISTVDGVKIDFKEGWVHLRKSNTEPIIRVYSESSSKEKANAMAHEIMEKIS